MPGTMGWLWPCGMTDVTTCSFLHVHARASGSMLVLHPACGMPPACQAGACLMHGRHQHVAFMNHCTDVRCINVYPTNRHVAIHHHIMLAA